MSPTQASSDYTAPIVCFQYALHVTGTCFPVFLGKFVFDLTFTLEQSVQQQLLYTLKALIVFVRPTPIVRVVSSSHTRLKSRSDVFVIPCGALCSGFLHKKLNC